MMPIRLFLPDETAAAAVGSKLAPLLETGDVVLLEGPLGAGKTTLARGLIIAFCGALEVPSPTFTLVETYEGAAGTLWHFDLYRLEKREDVWELGLEEALDNGVALIEWPDRIDGLIPTGALRLKLFIQEGGRRLEIEAPPRWLHRLSEAGIS